MQFLEDEAALKKKNTWAANEGGHRVSISRKKAQRSRANQTCNALLSSTIYPMWVVVGTKKEPTGEHHPNITQHHPTPPNSTPTSPNTTPTSSTIRKCLFFWG
ncbi:hypothetical protein EYF80_040966 [Liparis tanakae]|uniref:Uncharacterized protein n=1 Tax=Liparis tanakae TaxID=230148 RepID=A0A4Z2G8D0_9TELE|nr:hypothetical protein EYF80_040966 [Liparis tanakae]